MKESLIIRTKPESERFNRDNGFELPDCWIARTGASGRNVGKISFFAIKLSTREQSASFHDHRSN